MSLHVEVKLVVSCDRCGHESEDTRSTREKFTEPLGLMMAGELGASLRDSGWQTGERGDYCSACVRQTRRAL